MKYSYLLRNIAKFIISKLSKLFLEADLITIADGKIISFAKGSYVNVLILPFPEVGNDYAVCKEYNPTKLIESFLEQHHADKTRFYYYGGGIIEPKYGMISVDSNCLLVNT